MKIQTSNFQNHYLVAGGASSTLTRMESGIAVEHTGKKREGKVTWDMEKGCEKGHETVTAQLKRAGKEEPKQR